MTVTIKSETIDGYYVAIEQDKYSNGYKVSISEVYDGYCGYPISERYYGTLAQAKRRYGVLRREARQ